MRASTAETTNTQRNRIEYLKNIIQKGILEYLSASIRVKIV